jgi:hypothetical protein
VEYAYRGMRCVNNGNGGTYELAAISLPSLNLFVGHGKIYRVDHDAVSRRLSASSRLAVIIRGL